MTGHCAELELLNELCRCAALVARNYIACDSHYAYFGSAEDVVHFKAVLRQAGDYWLCAADFVK